MAATQSTHPDELLPWYVNGTLSDTERETVLAHLKTCERCRHEVALLNRLRESVKSEEILSPGEFGFHRLLADIKRDKKTPRGTWGLGLAVAAGVVIVIQAAVLLQLWSPRATYAPAGAHANEPTLQVRFAANATEQQLREILRSVEGTIVDGPSAQGLYRVRLDRPSPVARAELERVAQTLKNQSGVVDYAATE
jgi:anti-sigma factor RsiW